MSAGEQEDQQSGLEDDSGCSVKDEWERRVTRAKLGGNSHGEGFQGILWSRKSAFYSTFTAVKETLAIVRVKQEIFSAATRIYLGLLFSIRGNAFLQITSASALKE